MRESSKPTLLSKEIITSILFLVVSLMVISVPSWLERLGVNISMGDWYSQIFPLAFITAVWCVTLLLFIRRKESGQDKKIDTLIKSCNKLIKEIRADRKARHR